MPYKFNPFVGQFDYYEKAGGGGSAYVHIQSTASSIWTINHNLGIFPSVDIFDTGNQMVEAEVVHITSNTTIITFSSPLAGYARLN